MLESHRWARNIIEARCPYCHKYNVVGLTNDKSEGCIVKCPNCRQLFKLGKRRIIDITKNIRRLTKRDTANG